MHCDSPGGYLKVGMNSGIARSIVGIYLQLPLSNPYKILTRDPRMSCSAIALSHQAVSISRSS
jgi:hypothetical protein